MPRHGKYPYELPERAVRLVLENESELLGVSKQAAQRKYGSKVNA